MKISLYADGSIFHKQKVGGWAFAFEHEGERVSLCGAEHGVTGNAMELLAVVKGLRYVMKRTTVRSVTVISDSQYVIYGASRYLPDWRTNKWYNASGRIVSNKDLWVDLDNIIHQFGQTRWQWVRGHKGVVLNELCDKLARSAAKELMQA